ncbi:MAG: FAD-dependent oxidoreductase, partial [Proteobacteria bacterium]|nr:FAD-dependent oxidoreductase [Pseudomonadota bacterium]
MAEKTNFDIIIIGGGPGGYVAAIRAAQLGGQVALIEAEHLGGICLNWGCIPTKALLRTAEVFHLMNHAGDYGLSAKEISFDIAKTVKRSRDIAKRLSAGVKHLLKKNKVTVFDGHGRLDGPGKVEVRAGKKKIASLTAKNIILSSGARARDLPGLEADGKLVWSYKEAMVPEAMPKSLLVVGSGAIGMEFASFYRTLGADVTVVEILPGILPVEDAEIAALARKAFEAQGMKIHTGATVTSLQKAAKNVTAVIDLGDGKTSNLTVDKVILAIGITGNVEDLGLEGTKVVVERGHIVIDQWLQTGEPGVYAIGDVVGPPWLAHKASHEGVICVEKIAGLAGVRPLKTANIPGCT